MERGTGNNGWEGALRNSKREKRDKEGLGTGRFFAIVAFNYRDSRGGTRETHKKQKAKRRERGASFSKWLVASNTGGAARAREKRKRNEVGIHKKQGKDQKRQGLALGGRGREESKGALKSKGEEPTPAKKRGAGKTAQPSEKQSLVPGEGSDRR